MRTSDLLGSSVAIVMFGGTQASAQISWAAPVDGVWNVAANWSPANVPNALNERAVLGHADPYTVSVDTNTTVGGVSINNPLATLVIESNIRLTVGPLGMSNGGTIVINPNGTSRNTYLELSANAVLAGIGIIRLGGGSSPSWAQISTTNSNTDTATIGPGITIVGNGGLFGRLISQGTIGGGAGGDGPVIRGVIRQESGGKVLVDVAGRFASIGDGGTLRGGRIETQDGGIFQVLGRTGAFESVTNQGTMHIVSDSTLRVNAPGMTNNGVIIVNPTAANRTTILELAAGATLGGNGVVTLGHITNNWAQLGSTNSNTDEAILGPGAVVNGNGGIFARLVNRGTIAGGAGGDGPVIRGIIRQEDAGKVRVDVAGRFASIGTGGILRGGTLETADGGVVQVIGQPGVVEGVTNLGTLHIVGDSTLRVNAPGFTNHGVIIINPSAANRATKLELAAGVTLSGNGVITLAHESAAWSQIATTNTNTDEASIGPGITINGAGGIAGRIVNRGTIAPGVAIGTMRRDGTITQASTGVIEIQLAGAAANQRDALVGNGVLILDGTLRVQFLNNYVLPPGASYTAISGGTIQGRFARIEGPVVAGKRLAAQYTASSVTIVWECAADFNGDDFVDFFDYSDFVQAFESGGPGADFNSDGFVDFFDYGDFVAAFETGC